MQDKQDQQQLQGQLREQQHGHGDQQGMEAAWGSEGSWRWGGRGWGFSGLAARAMQQLLWRRLLGAGDQPGGQQGLQWQQTDQQQQQQQGQRSQGRLQTQQQHEEGGQSRRLLDQQQQQQEEVPPGQSRRLQTQQQQQQEEGPPGQSRQLLEQQQQQGEGSGPSVAGGGALQWGQWTVVPNATAVTLLHMPSGGYSMSAKAIDAAGNVGKPCEPVYFTVRAGGGGWRHGHLSESVILSNYDICLGVTDNDNDQIVR